MEGHLHWAWNAWYVGSYDGDSTIVYPDKENMTVKSSLRYEAHRDGLEDYELMEKLKQSNPELAREIADMAVSPDDPTKYTLDPEYVKQLHDYLVKAAAGEEVGEVPQPTSPYLGQETPRTYMADNTDSEINYSGDWYARNRQFAYSGSVHSTSDADDFVEYEFYGEGIDVVVEKKRGCGKSRDLSKRLGPSKRQSV